MPEWNELFKQAEFQWKEPNEQVVALVPLLKERGVHRVLDLACGAGRHLVYLEREGFDVYGLDLAENGLEHARQWLAREGLQARLAKCNMVHIPFADRSFDAMLCVHAVQHQRLAGIQETIDEVARVLRPGAFGFLTFPSTRDDRYGAGREIEPGTFEAAEGPDRGVPHHYSTLAEIEKLFEQFAIRKIELDERRVDGKGRYSHWNVLVERE